MTSVIFIKSMLPDYANIPNYVSNADSKSMKNCLSPEDIKQLWMDDVDNTISNASHFTIN